MKTEDIIYSLQKYWDSSSPEGGIVTYPGAEIDVSAQSEWIEFWVSQIHGFPHRRQSPESFSFLVDLHFFSRTANKRLVLSRIDAARVAFQATSIVVNSVEAPSTQVGQLRFREPVIRDFTRNETTGHQTALQHFVMSIEANALEALNGLLLAPHSL